jgi:hypothetical protein
MHETKPRNTSVKMADNAAETESSQLPNYKSRAFNVHRNFAGVFGQVLALAGGIVAELL